MPTDDLPLSHPVIALISERSAISCAELSRLYGYPEGYTAAEDALRSLPAWRYSIGVDAWVLLPLSDSLG